jgi:hypothetical protein
VTPARLRELLSLAETRKARDLARLDAFAAEDRALAAALAELAATHARDMAEGPGAAPLALLGQRLVWADRRSAAIRAERARLAGRLAAARAEATVAIGKHRALESLIERADRDALRTAEARREREAPPRPDAVPGA